MNTNTRVLDDSTRNDGSARAAIRLRRAGVILLAAAVAMADWFISTRLIGLDLIVNQGRGNQQIQPALVIGGAIVPGLCGWLLLAILERAVPRRATIVWRVIATVVLAVSLLSPITLAQSISTMISLLSMHFLVGAIMIIGLPRGQFHDDSPQISGSE